MEPLDLETIMEIRGILAPTLLHECNIQTNTGGLVSGAPRAVWTDAETLIACNCSPTGGTEGQRNDETAIQETWQVRLPAETVVSDQNRLIVTGTDPISGLEFTRTLIPTNIPAPRYGEVARMVICREAAAGEL